jgi:polysaccharide pyruvyl transferase WcaK-like protein
MALEIQNGVVELLPGGQCALLSEAHTRLAALQKSSSPPRIHCYLGTRNVFESEQMLALFKKLGLQVTFSPGTGTALDPEQRFHLANFLDGVRARYESDVTRNRFYRRWRDEALSTGFAAYDAAHVSLPRTPRQLPSVRGWLRQLFQPGAVQQETNRIAEANSAAKSAAPVARPTTGRILICGWYGTETLGDKAILGGVIAAARRVRPDVIVDVASLEPYVSHMTSRQMPDLGIDRVLGPADARKAVQAGNYEMVVVGGGPLMSPVPWCTHLLELVSDARRVGAKTVVAGCGVGPLFVEHRNAAIQHLLELADEVVLRDRASAECAKNALGVTRSCATGLDPAFIWIRDHLSPAVERNPNQILLALRDWPISEFAASMNQTEAEKLKARFEAELHCMLETLVRENASLQIVPFCMHKYSVGGDDRIFYRRLLADFPEILACLDDRHRSPSEDLQTIARSRAMFAMRFHSVVFALATSTPFVAVDYTMGGKIQGLLRDVNETERLLPMDSFDGRKAAKDLLSATPPAAGLQSSVAATETTLSEAFRRAWQDPAGSPGGRP